MCYEYASSSPELLGLACRGLPCWLALVFLLPARGLPCWLALVGLGPIPDAWPGLGLPRWLASVPWPWVLELLASGGLPSWLAFVLGAASLRRYPSCLHRDRCSQSKFILKPCSAVTGGAMGATKQSERLGGSSTTPMPQVLISVSPENLRLL